MLQPLTAFLLTSSVWQANTFPTITPESCLAHVRFLASDLLEGRGTPSPGLEIAAEYIAAQFAAAGISPGVKDSFFQVSEFENRRSAVKGRVRNVIGMIKGTDPKLKDTFVLVTAHYDHLGKRSGEGDQIFNGANDNASGTSGVIEIAKALAASKPKRNIVFIAFWGEEMGLQGARYYVQNPVFPLKATNCVLNLEQIGRTDDDEGPRVSEFNVTGFDMTTLAEHLKKSATPYSVKVSMHAKNSTPFFFASDNAAFATAGVPANTVSTAYGFPEYHQAGDESSKIHPENMAKIVKALAAGTLNLANDAKNIEWNKDHKGAARFVEAHKKLHGG